MASVLKTDGSYLNLDTIITKKFRAGNSYTIAKGDLLRTDTGGYVMVASNDDYPIFGMALESHDSGDGDVALALDVTPQLIVVMDTSGTASFDHTFEGAYLNIDNSGSGAQKVDTDSKSWYKTYWDSGSSVVSHRQLWCIDNENTYDPTDSSIGTFVIVSYI